MVVRRLVAAALGLSALFLLLAGEPSHARTPGLSERAEQYIRARRAYEEETTAYWRALYEKRRARNAKRRDGRPIDLDDYVLSHPPIYSGPPRPPDIDVPDSIEPVRPPIPVVADFLKAAAEQFGFMPRRPASEIEFKRAYARAAAAAGLTREQIVGIYVFETGGNGTYDVQAGLTSQRPGARAISPALGYNQLLSTNSVGLLAEHGDRYLATLQKSAERLAGTERAAMERKLAAFQRMVAFSRTVPKNWNEHDKLAKTTPGGMGIHAAVLDIDIGPLLQTQKLADSVSFARAKGYAAPLTAAELEAMNFTGDGNGFDMATMPPDLRQRVPTANFFVREGYERNPIARRTGTVAGLFAAVVAKMNQGAQAPGARELAAAFQGM